MSKKNKNKGNSPLQTSQLGGPVEVEEKVETPETASTETTTEAEEKVETASTEAEATEEKTQKYKVTCNIPTPTKIDSGTFDATSEADAKAQFLKAAGILATKHPINVEIVEDMSDLFEE